ncbi:plasmid mobilization relaxosome protein MobC [Pseudomonas helleri]|nr:plasmid mobilization relaxosome protein MobC [Pseudomonas helleri]
MRIAMSKKKRSGEQFNIRISKEAKDKIVANAKTLKLSQAKYIERIGIEGCKIIEVNNPDLNRNIHNIIKHLESMGNNLNQIAKQLNSQKNIDTKSFDEMKRLLDGVYIAVTERETKEEITTTRTI